MTQLTAEVGEKLLICCDGIVEKLTNQQVVNFIEEHYKHNNSSNSDPAAIMSKLLDYSLNTGSKDNMSSMLIEFVDNDCSSYTKGNEFIAGSYSGGEDDKKFMDAYINDAKRHGIETDKLMKMGKENEAKWKNEKKNNNNNHSLMEE